MPGLYPGRVIEVGHSGSVGTAVKNGYTERNREAVKAMVARGMKELTGADDAVSAGGRGAGTPVTVTWTKFRGPGKVTFAEARPMVEKASFKPPQPAVFSGAATTSVEFGQPGEYVLRVVANDSSGDGGRGFQCCWTNAQVKVTVR